MASDHSHDLDILPVAAACVTEDGRILHYNQLFAKLTGSPKPGSLVVQLARETERDSIHLWIRDTIKSKVPTRHSIIQSASEQHQSMLHLQALYNEENRTLCITVVDFDAPARYEMDILEKYEFYFKEIMNSPDFVLCRFNFIEDRFEYMSPAAESLVALPLGNLQEFTYRDLLKMIHPSERQNMASFLQKLISGEVRIPSLVEQFRLGDIPRRDVWVQVHMRFMYDDSNRLAFALVSVFDITEQKRIEKALTDSRNELEARVMERTLELIKTNERLLSEISERIHAEIEVKESEERFRSIFEQAYDGVVLLDADGRIIAWNRAMTRMTNLKAPKVIGRPFWDVQAEIVGNHQSHEYVRRMWQARVERFRQNETADFINMIEEDDIMHPTLGKLNVERVVFPIRTSNELRLGMLMRDISTTRQSLEALRESEEKFRILSQESPNLILIFTRDSIESMNGNWSRLTGFDFSDRAKMVHTLLNALPPEKRIRALRIIARIDEVDVLLPWETSLETAIGERLTLVISCRKIQYASKPAVLAIATDITEIRRMQRRIEDAKRFKEIDRLSVGVAHEVRNPLNSIVAISEVLSSEFGELPSMQEYLNHINIQVERLSRLMGDLLDFGKKTHVEILEMISLLTLCQSTVKMWQQENEYPGFIVEIDTLLCPEEPLVRTDVPRLQQVLLNLLDNAAQHSQESRKIIMRLFSEGESQVSLQVIDFGHGVNPKDISRVFDPFFTRRSKGTGLGLSIVKSIIEKMDGSVELANHADPQGCVVTLRLPMMRGCET